MDYLNSGSCDTSVCLLKHYSDAAAGLPMQHCALQASTVLSDRVLDFLNRPGSSYQSMYVKILKYGTVSRLHLIHLGF